MRQAHQERAGRGHLHEGGAQRFEAEYLKDAEGLNCKKPTVQPRATEHIQQILDIVKDLIDSGHAYVAKNGDVYFRVKSIPATAN